MDAYDYQILARNTLIDSPGKTFTDTELMKVWCAIGLGGEAGEVLEYVKKSIFHQVPLSKDTIAKEIGDVMWYVASLCTLYDLDLSDVLTANIDKLAKRYPNGFVPGGGNR